MRKWEPPQLLNVGALPQSVGDCFTGATEGSTFCANGGQTDEPGTIPGQPHYCADGGYASTNYGGCSAGEEVFTIP